MWTSCPPQLPEGHDGEQPTGYRDPKESKDYLFICWEGSRGKATPRWRRKGPTVQVTHGNEECHPGSLASTRLLEERVNGIIALGFGLCQNISFVANTHLKCPIYLQKGVF